MCDAATETKVLSAIDGRITAQQPFSAFDITVELRRQGVAERHKNLKGVVHQAFADGRMGDWQKTMVTFPNAPIPAWLYHPPGADVAGYMAGLQGPPVAIVQPPPQAQAPVPPAPPPAAPRTGVGSGVVKDPGVSCLYVPSTLAAKVGITPGNKAYMAISGKYVEIGPSPFTPNGLCMPLRKVHVDKYRNVRVPNTALLKAGLDGSVRIEINGGRIVVGSPLKN
jgi:hypothetical protein